MGEIKKKKEFIGPCKQKVREMPSSSKAGSRGSNHTRKPETLHFWLHFPPWSPQYQVGYNQAFQGCRSTPSLLQMQQDFSILGAHRRSRSQILPQRTGMLI